MPNAFIGIDLAWHPDKNHTGCACLVGNECGALLHAVSDGIHSMEGIVDFVRTHAADTTVIAVDAPLVVTNLTGQRECERAVTECWGPYDAGCYPSNLGRTPSPAGVRLVERLAELGYRNDFPLHSSTPPVGRWVFEVYPHPAVVSLFNLPSIVKYKKGRVAVRRQGLQHLQRLVAQLADTEFGVLPSPPLDFLTAQDVGTLGGRTLKRLEDRLDAVICSYLAFRAWCWGIERMEPFGDIDHGRIVVPRRRKDQTPPCRAT